MANDFCRLTNRAMSRLRANVLASFFKAGLELTSRTGYRFGVKRRIQKFKDGSSLEVSPDGTMIIRENKWANADFLSQPTPFDRPTPAPQPISYKHTPHRAGIKRSHGQRKPS